MRNGDFDAQAIQDHGGRVDVESAESRRTTFTGDHPLPATVHAQPVDANAVGVSGLRSEERPARCRPSGFVGAHHWLTLSTSSTACASAAPSNGLGKKRRTPRASIDRVIAPAAETTRSGCSRLQ